MQDDPYIGMLEIMQGEAGKAAGDTGMANVHIGKVNSLNPISIQGPGIELTANDVQINHMLSFKEQEGPFDNRLMVGDSVLMLTGDNQMFYIICKL